MRCLPTALPLPFVLSGDVGTSRPEEQILVETSRSDAHPTEAHIAAGRGTNNSAKTSDPNVRVGSIATELDLSDDVRFSLESDRLTDIPDWQLRATSGHSASAAIVSLARAACPRRSERSEGGKYPFG